MQKKTNNVLIIGSGAVGLSVGYLLHDKVVKYYLGRGSTYKFLSEKILITTSDLYSEPKIISNIRKFGNCISIEDINCLIIAIREHDLEKIGDDILDLCNNVNCVIIVCNTLSSFNSVKCKINNSNTYLAIINSGIKYVSPKVLHIIDNNLRIYIRAKKDDLPDAFRKGSIKEMNSNNENTILLERYLKNSLSFLSIIFKCNIGELLETKKEFIYRIFLEFSEKLCTEHDAQNLFDQLYSSPEVMHYYPSEYESYYLRGNTFQWRFFYDDCKRLFGDDLLRKQHLMALFKQLENF